MGGLNEVNREANREEDQKNKIPFLDFKAATAACRVSSSTSTFIKSSLPSFVGRLEKEKTNNISLLFSFHSRVCIEMKKGELAKELNCV